MKFPATRLPFLATPLLLSVLGGCGGGSNGGAAPVAPQPATPPRPAPTVSSIAPATAILGRPTDFEVTGTDLSDGMRFQLAGCTPTEVAGGSNTRRVFSCTPSGTAGEHTLQVYASASAASSLVSKTVHYLTPVAKVGESNGGLIVLKEDGSLWSWANDWDKSTESNVVIITTRLGSNFNDVEVGSSSSLAIDADGGLWAWGFNTYGTFAGETPAGSPTPIRIGADYASVAVKGAHTTGGERVVGLKRDGSLWAWGSRSSPVPEYSGAQAVPHQFGSGFSTLATGATGRSMALKPDGSLWAWNENISPAPFIPTRIGSDYQTVVSAFGASYGIKTNGELWAWGHNVPQRAPAAGDDAPVLMGQGYVSLSAGSYYVMALKADGTLWGFGSNAEGQFGDGTTNGGGPVLSATGVRKVWAGDSCTVVEKRDGSLWATRWCTLGRMSGSLPPNGLRRLPQF